MCCHYAKLPPEAIVLAFLYRVAANMENLEYSGISLNMENSWNSQRILCNLREN